ncbi:hypothetical protein SAMN05444359_14022 [Neolewinella agarilytica]|uniref:Uncharacterized protein n=1 Tax=Neolewinella agarilytica TaxID=478744 RepID=A0A1H9NXA3_9BACT|nr:hypothetical protein SAMN05444359_14022 [Neolewinella agarilytica]
MKKLFALLLCLGTATSLFAQPANDLCDDAIALVS